MKARIRFTRGAEADLSEIDRYSRKRDGAEQARLITGRIRDMIMLLETHPEAGSVPEQLASLGIAEFRQIVSGPYLVIYTHEGEDVFVLLVADGRRDYQALLKRRVLG